jgi:hypothetical protein
LGWCAYFSCDNSFDCRGSNLVPNPEEIRQFARIMIYRTQTRDAVFLYYPLSDCRL